MSFLAAFEKAEPAKADLFRPLPGVTPVPFAEASGCRWPLALEGDPVTSRTTHVCGAVRCSEKLSYCAVHQRLSIGSGTRSERAAVRDAGKVAA